jgi:hypothetical protein
MQTYSVMLEGIDSGMGYFMNFEVAAPNQRTAIKIAEERALELGLTIVGVEEVTATGRTRSSEPTILSTSGKSYFPTGH